MALESLPGDPFDALGDGNRRAIVELLRSGDRSVQQLADALPISRPAVSRHLRLLKDAGLVADRAEGTRRLYRLHDEGIAAVQRYLEQVWGDAATRFRLAAENLTAQDDPSPRSNCASPWTARRRTHSTCGHAARRCGGRPTTRCRATRT
jgi:DNA-binding transcriptional ArsR family regulator